MLSKSLMATRYRRIEKGGFGRWWLAGFVTACLLFTSCAEQGVISTRDDMLDLGTSTVVPISDPARDRVYLDSLEVATEPTPSESLSDVIEVPFGTVNSSANSPVDEELDPSSAKPVLPPDMVDSPSTPPMEPDPIGSPETKPDVLPNKDENVRYNRRYGNAIGASALGPHRLGGPLNTYRQSYRFEALASESVASFRWYNQYEGSQGAPRSGYYNQGSIVPISLEVRADDGQGFPDMSGAIYGNANIANTLNEPTYSNVIFSNLLPLTKGETYHIVLTNLSPDPKNNFSSTNHLWLLPEDVDGTNNQFALTDKQWALTYYDPSDEKWHDRDDYNDIVKSPSWDRRTSRNTPIGEVCLSGGACIGQGYVHGLAHYSDSHGHLRDVQGASQVRQRFTPNSTKQIQNLHLFGMRNGTPGGPLAIILKECVGSTLWEGTIDASDYPLPIAWHNGYGPSNFDWARVDMPEQRLLAGTEYCLEMSAPAGDPYWIKSMEHGGSSLFTCAAKFCDGYSQYSSDGGLTWNNSTIWGSPSTYADLSFFFDVID